MENAILLIRLHPSVILWEYQHRFSIVLKIPGKIISTEYEDMSGVREYSGQLQQRSRPPAENQRACYASWRPLTSEAHGMGSCG